MKPLRIKDLPLNGAELDMAREEKPKESRIKTPQSGIFDLNRTICLRNLDRDCVPK